MFIHIIVKYILVNAVCYCAEQGKGPLHLTPYLDNGAINKARELSAVSLHISKSIPKSYAGFFTVDRALGNHLFFWFFPHPETSSTTPLLIWLNGGPGSSSMVGLLWENGPVDIGNFWNGTFHKRKHAWTDHFSMLYIDNPVGTGYSYSDSGETGYRPTADGYTNDMYNFLQQFYVMFPEYLSRDLYIGGQSYAGKYVPELAYRIHIQIQFGNSNIPLTGIYIGGAYFDPLSQSLAFFEYIYALGLISYAQKNKHQASVLSLFSSYENGDLSPDTTADFINDVLLPDLGIPSFDNYVTFESPNLHGVNQVMSSEDIRRAIHVSDLNYVSYNHSLSQIYGMDLLVSVKSKMAILMDSYKTLLFSGDYDVVVSGVTVEAALLDTPWSLQAKYNDTSRLVWYSDDSGVRGFYSETGQFCRVIVHGAGHHIPHDQPASTLDMMLQFVNHGCLQNYKYN